MRLAGSPVKLLAELMREDEHDVALRIPIRHTAQSFEWYPRGDVEWIARNVEPDRRAWLDQKARRQEPTAVGNLVAKVASKLVADHARAAAHDVDDDGAPF